MKQPPPPRKRTFLICALFAALVMFLMAGALSVHVWKTKQWLKQIKAGAAARSVMMKEKTLARSDSNACPDDKPVLIGFNDHGKAICRAFSSASCAPGQYIAAIDPQTLDLRCVDAGGDVVCPPNSYITEFMWLGENKTSFSCFQRLDPFKAWKFEPVLSSRGN